MTIGVSLLLITGVLIYFGIARSILDRLKITDTVALFIIAAIIAGSFLTIPLSRDPLINLNVGGGLIPIFLAIYILSRAESTTEVLRAIAATVLTAAVIYAVTIIFQDFGEGRDIIDPMYIFAVVGGVFGYLFGRSRRGSFVAGSLGFLLYELINVWKVLSGRIVTEVRLGGAGAFDSIVISGLFAVLLAELIGETRERIQGGPRGDERRNDSE